MDWSYIQTLLVDVFHQTLRAFMAYKGQDRVGESNTKLCFSSISNSRKSSDKYRNLQCVRRHVWKNRPIYILIAKRRISNHQNSIIYFIRIDNCKQTSLSTLSISEIYQITVKANLFIFGMYRSFYYHWEHCELSSISMAAWASMLKIEKSSCNLFSCIEFIYARLVVYVYWNQFHSYNHRNHFC